MDISELQRQTQNKFGEHRVQLNEIIARLQTNVGSGLSTAEAKKRLGIFGPNLQKNSEELGDIKVLRDNVVINMDSTQIVPGDVIYLTTGNMIPADLRIISSENCKVNNSCLTGESEPQSRTADFTDDNPLETKNLLFYPATVVQGVQSKSEHSDLCDPILQLLRRSVK